MRRIVVEQFVSLDGVAEGPGRFGEYEHRGWTVPYWGDDIEKWHTDQLLDSDALLLRRGQRGGSRTSMVTPVLEVCEPLSASVVLSLSSWKRRFPRPSTTG